MDNIYQFTLKGNPFPLTGFILAENKNVAAKKFEKIPYYRNLLLAFLANTLATEIDSYDVRIHTSMYDISVSVGTENRHIPVEFIHIATLS
jgi:hypothetical protein